MHRRSFLKGLVGIFAAGAAPAVLPSGIIMPVRKLWTPYGIVAQLQPCQFQYNAEMSAMLELLEWQRGRINKIFGLPPHALYGRTDG